MNKINLEIDKPIGELLTFKINHHTLKQDIDFIIEEDRKTLRLISDYAIKASELYQFETIEARYEQP